MASPHIFLEYPKFYCEEIQPHLFGHTLVTSQITVPQVWKSAAAACYSSTPPHSAVSGYDWPAPDDELQKIKNVVSVHI